MAPIAWKRLGWLIRGCSAAPGLKNRFNSTALHVGHQVLLVAAGKAPANCKRFVHNFFVFCLCVLWWFFLSDFPCGNTKVL